MKKNSLRFCLILLTMMSISGLSFGDELILRDTLKDSILYELSGLKALDYIASLCNFDRSGASQGLYDSQVWVSNKLKSWGIEDVVIDSYPADAKTFYLDTHRARLAWEKKKAKLFLVEPYTKKIIDYDEIPTALIKYSNSANVEAELVDIGPGTSEEDYDGKDIKDKIVLTSSSSYAVFPKAIKEKGALAIISYWENYEPDRSRFPDQVPWMSFPQELDTNHFGFAVSRNIADELKTLLTRGKVVLKAEVEAQNKIGKYHVLSSSLAGAEIPNKEIILTAHINHYKPAANDNASGCALMMEIERAVKTMVDEGRIPPLKRTLRFVWTLEHTGTKVYIDGRPDLDKRGIAAINLDMVGENVLLCESSIRLVLGPHSCPSFLDDLMNNIMAFVGRSNFTEKRGTVIPFTYVLEPYNGAISDHYYYPTGRIGIPATFLYAWPDNFYHSNEDTPDKCDPTILKRLGFVSAAAALYLATAGEKESLELCNLVFSEGSKRLAQAAKQGVNFMKNAEGKKLHRAYFEAVNRLQKTAEKEVKAIQSVYRLSKTTNIERRVQRCMNAVHKITQIHREFLHQNYTEFCTDKKQKPQELALSAKEKEYSRIIPQRHFRGPLYLRYVKTKMSQEKRNWFNGADRRIRDFFLIKDEIINFVDDRNSILDIRNAVSAEFYPLDLDDIYTFLDGIRETGYITFVKN